VFLTPGAFAPELGGRQGEEDQETDDDHGYPFCEGVFTYALASLAGRSRLVRAGVRRIVGHWALLCLAETLCPAEIVRKEVRDASTHPQRQRDHDGF
jgi:hypothetical protein